MNQIIKTNTQYILLLLVFRMSLAVDRPPSYNNFMSENKPHRNKNENMKTETSALLKTGEIQLGKPVKLPYIRKISTNGSNNPNLSRKSLEGKETRVMRTSNKQLQLLQQTHLNLLTLQEMELCNSKSREKECFPRINMPNPIFARERSIDSLENHHRMRSEKSMTKIQFTDTLKDYRLGPIIGRGTYSVVRMVRNQDGKKYAVKTYSKSNLVNEDRKLNLQNQIKILQTVQHPSLLAYQQTIQTEQSVNIVTELCENRSLADWVKSQGKLSEMEAKIIIKQIAKVLQYLHNLEIVHRDLKLDNILINKEGRIKLIDFGFSRQLPRETFMLYDFCGTPHYISPEVIQREGYFGKPADIWSLGIAIYKMVVGSFPFKGINQKALFLKVVKGDLRLPAELSPELSSLLGRILNFDYRKRPTAQELVKDDWFIQ